MKRYTMLPLVLLTSIALAQQTLDVDPYAETSGEFSGTGFRVVPVRPGKLNVLSANLAKLSAKVKPHHLNFMDLWVSSEEAGSHCVDWLLKSPDAGHYLVSALLEAEDCSISVQCNGRAEAFVIQERKWNRVSLGSIALKKGENRLGLMIETDVSFKLSTLELTQPDVKQQILSEALALRRAPDWFKDAGYGLMFQWTNRATPPTGSNKPWGQKVNDFDLDAFIQLVDQSGASYVVWSITWGQQYISAPIKSLDRIIAGRTTQRDLLGEMADRLHAKGIRLIFYYHYGYDCYHSKDPQWLTAAGGYDADKTGLYQNIMSIFSEVGERYAEKLDGWFLDGGQRYYNTHFDGSDPVGILSAPFKAIGRAARKGNAERILCYNPWILPRLTEYQDYYAGEGKAAASGLDDGVFTQGAQKGLMAFGCFVLEKRWGHIDENKPIAEPRYSATQLVNRIDNAKKNRYPIAINLEMYEDGSVSPASAQLLKEVRKTLQGTFP